ncbi:uncharacterized protein F5891DRAFT_1180194 [Suillus fuscotomentosus]|uniref:Uncharacterized protein n=1 Tax=Suillus fuscotomentosus TaxID=1912939 RepID=A0AAD4EM77_9AGAM|nr:uncharacterized protein F5891DRAFT_1180194 [Suillus fuscotomentosus]KAG1908661.1 hypothetical protein F5891DRAFT_1180194 [Suillus fuscotomentosus]
MLMGRKSSEVLSNVNGHSFEAGTWSISVLLLLLSETDPDNLYEFSPERHIASDTKDYQSILDPSKCPTLFAILKSPFIGLSIVPPFIPVSALDAPPGVGR